MDIKRAYRFRFYPTPEQEVILAQTFGCVRVVYNHMLRLRSEVFVVEQACVFLDMDGLDAQCLHVLGEVVDQDGNAVDLSEFTAVDDEAVAEVLDEAEEIVEEAAQPEPAADAPAETEEKPKKKAAAKKPAAKKPAAKKADAAE